MMNNKTRPTRRQTSPPTPMVGTTYSTNVTTWNEFLYVLSIIDPADSLNITLKADLFATSSATFGASAIQINGDGHTIYPDPDTPPYDSPFILPASNSSLIMIGVALTEFNVPVITSSGTLTLDNVHASYNTSGVIVHNFGVLEIRNSSKFDHNYNVNPGGVIHSTTNNTISLKNSEFSDNTSGNCGGVLYRSGAGLVEIDNCTLVRNKAQAVRATVNDPLGCGGALCALDSNLQVKNNSVVEYNEAVNDGGGVYIATPATFTLEGSSLSNNEAKGNGGGLYNYNGSFVVGISKPGGAPNTVNSNTAGGAGGGIYIFADGSLGGRKFTIMNSQVSYNSASWSGGGVYVDFAAAAAHSSETCYFAVASFWGNSAGNNGGAIGLSDTDYLDSVYSNNSTYKDNTAIKVYPFNAAADQTAYNAQVKGGTSFSGGNPTAWNNLDIEYHVPYAYVMPPVTKWVDPPDALTRTTIDYRVYDGPTWKLASIGHSLEDGTTKWDDFSLEFGVTFQTGIHDFHVEELSSALTPIGPTTFDVQMVSTDPDPAIDEYEFQTSYTSSLTPNTSFEFKNYEPIDENFRPSANVVKVGGAIAAGDFSFDLFEANSSYVYNPTTNLIETKTNTAQSSVNFTRIYYTRTGTHYYVIKDATANPGNASFRVKVDIVRLPGNIIQTLVEYPDGYPFFEEVERPDGAGVINFDNTLEFDEPGVYTFTLKETTPTGNGWETDDKVYTIVVNVQDDGMGNLVTYIEYPDGHPNFLNVYAPTPTTITIEGAKIVTTTLSSYPAKNFSFGAYENGVLVTVGTYDASTETFEIPIEYNEPGNHHYVIKELDPDGNGWVNDTTEFEVDVVVIDDGTGTLSGTLTYSDGSTTTSNIEFDNEYSVNPVSIHLSAMKRAIGDVLEDGMFKFVVKDATAPYNVRATAFNEGANEYTSVRASGKPVSVVKNNEDVSFENIKPMRYKNKRAATERCPSQNTRGRLRVTNQRTGIRR